MVGIFCFKFGDNTHIGRYTWTEFVLGSLLYSERFFSGDSSFSLSSKTSLYTDLVFFSFRKPTLLRLKSINPPRFLFSYARFKEKIDAL